MITSGMTKILVIVDRSWVVCFVAKVL